jgi:HSP20 family molecular chaperone IbpA
MRRAAISGRCSIACNGLIMSRFQGFASPLLLGFEEMERLLERAAKTTSDGYPPYNIERIAADELGDDLIRITLAVAGFRRDELEISVEERQLFIRGRQADDSAGRQFLHRGIAARQFQRTFLLAEGIEVTAARLQNGLLEVDLVRPAPERLVRRIEIEAKD